MLNQSIIECKALIFGVRMCPLINSIIRRMSALLRKTRRKELSPSQWMVPPPIVSIRNVANGRSLAWQLRCIVGVLPDRA